MIGTGAPMYRGARGEEKDNDLAHVRREHVRPYGCPVRRLAVLAALIAVAAGCTPSENPGRPVTVDIAQIGDDCWFEVGHRDRDGLPGGPTDPRVEVHCP